MTCNEARQHWMLYLDSEGDAELHFRVSDHLAMCPDCAAWFVKQERLERLLAERLRCTKASEELWRRVLDRSGLAPAARRGRGRRALWGLGCAFAVFALAAAGAFLLPHWLARPAHAGADLVQLTADCHERHLRGLSQVEFRCEDDREVERYIRQRVSFPVHCPAPKDVAFAVEGTGVCRWAPRPMVYFVGRVAHTAVSVFLLPRDSLDTFPRDRDILAGGAGRYRSQQGDYQVVARLTADAIVVVVGTVPAEMLEKLVGDYGSDG